MPVASNVSLRNSFLSQEPTLLHDIIVQAVQAQDARSRYTKGAVSMLLHPLPAKIALPSSAQDLFIQLFECAAEEPCVATVKPIYQILRGTSTLLMGLLSSNVLIRFEGHFFNIIRNLKGDHQSLSLYCLAIMKTMSSTYDDQLRFSASAYDTQDLFASTQLESSKWTPDHIEQFFTDSKAQRTMQLVVLRAMWSCSSSTSEPLDEKMESLCLAHEIITAVPVHLRENWRKANALVVRKLEEKALALSLEMELRFQALRFQVRVTEGNVVPAMVTDSLRQMMLKQDGVVQIMPSYRSVDFDFVANSGIFDQSTTTAFLQRTVDFAASANEWDIVEHCGILMQILQHLTAAMAYEKSITEGAVLALDVLSCGEKLSGLSSLTNQFSADSSCKNRPGICSNALQRARNCVAHEICTCFLKAALSSSHSTYSVSQEIISLLLKLHASSAQRPPVCSHVLRSVPVQSRKFHFVETESTPNETCEPDWRETLQSELQNRAHSDQEHFASLFAKACEDLERRCQEVESPLRDVRDMRDALQAQYDRLNQAYATLDTECIDRNIRLNALEDERDQATDDLGSMRLQAEKSLQKARELEREIMACKTEAEKAQCSERQTREMANLQHATAFAKVQEELAELQVNLSSREGELRTKTDELDRVHKEMEHVKSTSDAAKEELEASSRTCAEQQATISNLTKDKDDEINLRHHLEAQLKDMSNKLDAEKGSHRNELDQLQQITDQALASTNHDNAQKLAEMSRLNGETIESLRQQLSDAQRQSRLARESCASAVERHNFEMSEKQRKVWVDFGQQQDCMLI